MIASSFVQYPDCTNNSLVESKYLPVILFLYSLISLRDLKFANWLFNIVESTLFVWEESSDDEAQLDNAIALVETRLIGKSPSASFFIYIYIYITFFHNYYLKIK